MSEYPNVDMFKDRTGVFFQADMCGERRFKSAKDAQTAYHEAQRKREQWERDQSAKAPNRVEIDLKTKQARIIKGGELTRTTDIRDLRHARQIVFDLLDEAESNDVIWI